MLGSLDFTGSENWAPFNVFLEHSLAHHYRQLALFPGKKPLNFLQLKMDNFYGPLSVSVTELNVSMMRPMTPN